MAISSSTPASINWISSRINITAKIRNPNIEVWSASASLLAGSFLFFVGFVWYLEHRLWGPEFKRVLGLGGVIVGSCDDQRSTSDSRINSSRIITSRLGHYPIPYADHKLASGIFFALQCDADTTKSRVSYYWLTCRAINSIFFMRQIDT